MVERLSSAEKLVFEERLNGENNSFCVPNPNGIPIIGIDESNEEKDFNSNIMVPIQPTRMGGYNKILRESYYGLYSNMDWVNFKYILPNLYGVLDNKNLKDLKEWELYELDKNNPDYNLGFNIRRRQYGLQSIELKVGNTYIMRLGKDNVIYKKMELINIIGGEHFPDLYFKDLEIPNNKGIINIGYHKILYQIKKIKDKKEQNGN